MKALDIVFAVVWAVFWLYWLCSAVNAKQARARTSGGVAVRLLIVIGVVVIVRANFLDARTAINSNPALQGLGLALLVTGLSVAVWARVNLGRNWGTPMSEKLEPELVQTGPYHWIRHPIYTGLIVATVGTAIALGLPWVIVALVLGGYFVYCAFVEERILRRLFPTAYPRYRASTKMLVPFLL